MRPARNTKTRRAVSYRLRKSSNLTGGAKQTWEIIPSFFMLKNEYRKENLRPARNTKARKAVSYRLRKSSNLTGGAKTNLGTNPSFFDVKINKNLIK